ncbi:E3 ubiquitin-protein ligase TRIM71-like [Ruditapes philippinarum]|uniref:E3 ubiquitin-protein ligase TRIM71-like n=1 Tax=Ruditapes philippinarum TaxID=129788 RepID=UPI00295B02BF|nr:E3 ubiquitin-protein ligase TRIM71-like [Ruditapes philippinarum]XP_060568511.1 E3 ubiquitin-protein ligase TRIM71-like [Ruditapes philippinarum]
MAVPGKKSSQKVSSTLSQGGAEDFDIFCNQCDRDDIRLPAFGYCLDCEVHLCQTCYNTHRRPKPLSHHQLLDKDHMPQKQNLSKSLKSTSGAQDGDLSKPCTKHTKEVIKFYCHDHNTLICSVCVTLEHTKTSCNVDYIPDISGQILNSTEFKETITDIHKLTEKCCQITKDMKQLVAKSTNSLKDAIAEIDNFRTEINKRLDELEKEVKDTATTIQHDNNKKLKTTEITCDNINRSLQATGDTLKHLNTNKKTDQLFTELKTAQQQILHNENIAKKLPTTNDVDEYNFEPNHAIKKLLQNEKSLGALRKKEIQQPAQPKNKAAVPVKMSTLRNINVKTSSDTKDCEISGITVSPQNQLFVADYNNSSIKMIDINSEKIKQLQLESGPWDITIVTRDTLAVTLPHIGTIQFISFSSNSLSLKNKLKVDGECFGISHHQGKLALTFTFPGKLQIMDLKGNIKITVERDSNGDSIFSDPWYVTTNNHSIYVSAHDKKEVIWFNWQGEIIGRNVDIERPEGISLLDDGSFFVSNYSGECIYRVSSDCKDMTTILNVEYAHAICWCAETSTLYLSTYKDYFDERNNHIKVYKMV